MVCLLNENKNQHMNAASRHMLLSFHLWLDNSLSLTYWLKNSITVWRVLYTFMSAVLSLPNTWNKIQRDKMAAETNLLRYPNVSTCSILLYFPWMLLSFSFKRWKSLLKYSASESPQVDCVCHLPCKAQCYDWGQGAELLVMHRQKQYFCGILTVEDNKAILCLLAENYKPGQE